VPARVMVDGQCYDYDTLDDVDLDNIHSLRDFMNLLFGGVSATRHAADMIIGETTTKCPGDGWGENCVFENGILYHLRCHPKGRIHNAIEDGELRTMKICRRKPPSHTRIITTIRFFKRDDLYFCNDQNLFNQSDWKRETYSAVGVPLIPVLLFEHHRTFPRDVHTQQWIESPNGFHAVLPSTVTLTTNTNHITRSIRAGMHQFVIAAGLLNVRMADKDKLSTEYTTNDAFKQLQLHAFNSIIQQLPSAEYKQYEFMQALCCSKMLSEMLSPSGLIDHMGSNIGRHALPDELVRPGEIQLLIAAIVRIAAYPERFRINGSKGTENDKWASSELAMAFEGNENHVVECSSLDKSADVSTVSKALKAVEIDKLYAIDVAINLAIKNVHDSLCVPVSSKKEVRRKIEARREKFSASLEYCFRAGTALCIDVAGPTCPHQLYTIFGYAQKMEEPPIGARVGRLDKKHGLGSLADICPPIRTCTRSKRQATLLKIMHDVETHLKKGVPYEPTEQTDASATGRVQPNDFYNLSSEDTNGFLKAPVYSSTYDIANCTAQDNRLCIESLDHAAKHLSGFFSHGPEFILNTGIEAYTFSEKTTNTCADCMRSISPVEGIALCSTFACQSCGRSRCIECSAQQHLCPKINCLRCCN